MSDPVVLTIINPVEGKRYRVSLRGDISRLSVRKLKRHLAPSVNILAEEQNLKYGGVELSDDVLCAEVGINHGSTITIERSGGNNSSLFSPRKEALEMETLEQQRATLQQERLQRDDEFRRQQELLGRSIAQAEVKKMELVREKQEREVELQRLQEMEELAEQERRRLADVRHMEADREAQRAKDLEARKEQLASERGMQRQLEITKLENERKKMLLQQQRSELEAERARLDREIRDRIQRQREAEMRIREREVELERIAIDGERAKREIELERAVLRQTREAEISLMNAERDAETKRLTHLTQQSVQNEVHRVQQHQQQNFHPQSSFAGSSTNPADSASSTPYRTTTQVVSSSQQNTQNNLVHSPRSTGRGNVHSSLNNIENKLMEIERQRNQPSSASSNQLPIPRGSSPARGDAETNGPPLTQQQLRRIAQANLDVLAEHLGVGELMLDDNHTCVVSVDDKYTLLITIDISTQRLYLYSTLSTHVPKTPNTKLKLYEFLLEGALLGRDMCGGGVGLSLKNDFVLMSTSIFLPLAAPTALRAITPKFVEALVMWRQRVQEILQESGEGGDSIVSGSTANTFNSQQQQQQQQQNNFSNMNMNMNMNNSVGNNFNNQQQNTERPVVGIEVTEQIDASPTMMARVSSSSAVAANGGQIPQGVLVVAAKGPAARGGVLAGDIIRAVNGIPTPDLDEFQRAVQQLRPNSTAHFVVNRMGADISLTILVGAAPMM